MWRPLSVLALLGAGLMVCPATGLAQRVAEVQVSPSDAQVQVGKTQAFLATAYDNAGNPIPTATISWASSNTRAATVDQNGIASGVGPGVTIITARTGAGSRAKTGQATVQVIGEGPIPQAQPTAQPPVQPPAQPRTPAGPRTVGPGCAALDRQPVGSGPAEGLIFDSLRISLVKGESRQLRYRAVRSDGENADRVCIQFAVDQGGERLAMVDTFGIVVAQGDTGRTVVRATVPGRTGWQPKQISVEVRGDSVRFGSREVSMAPLTVDTLAMTIPAQNRRLSPAAGIFQFSSSDPTKVRVSPVAPIVEAVNPGTARITAQSSMYPDITITVNVHRKLARLAATPTDSVITLAIGGPSTIRVQALAADSTPIPEIPLRWTLTDTTVVRFDQATKTLRGAKIGETRITVIAPTGRDSIVRSWRVRVVAGGLRVARNRVALGVGERAPADVQLLDDRRQPIGPAGQLSWASTDTSVAHVVEGQIVAASMGRARLTGRAPAGWDSTVAVDVFVVGDMVVAGLRGGRWDLYMVTTRGDQPKVRALTEDNALESQPAWSPNSTQIAYVAAQAVGSMLFDLYVANADGSEVRRLVSDTATVRTPVFVRPSGEQLVFESNKGGRSQLYSINRDGTGRRTLTTGATPNTQADVSPDGKKLLFTSLRETATRERNYDVFEMNLEGPASELRLTTSPRPEDSPAFAPDGRSFFYLRDEGGTPPTKRVYRQDLATAIATPLTQVGLFVQAFSVSADANTLALTVLQADASGAQSQRVMLFNVTTSTMTPLTLPGLDRVAAPVFRPAPPPQQ